MRARRVGGSVVELPSWVELRLSHGRYLDAMARPQTGIQRFAACQRCGKEELLIGERQDAEKALGRFATWHRRCPDPALRAAAVEQAPIDRQRAADRDAWFARRRRGY